MSVTVYSASWCKQCEFLKKELHNQEIDYEEVDVDTDKGMKIAKELGIRGLPFLHATNQYGSELKGSGLIMLKGLKDFLER